MRTIDGLSRKLDNPDVCIIASSSPRMWEARAIIRGAPHVSPLVNGRCAYRNIDDTNNEPPAMQGIDSRDGDDTPTVTITKLVAGDLQCMSMAKATGLDYCLSSNPGLERANRGWLYSNQRPRVKAICKISLRLLNCFALG